MLGEPENQFSLTRAALSTGGRAKSDFLSVQLSVTEERQWHFTGCRCGKRGLTLVRWQSIGRELQQFVALLADAVLWLFNDDWESRAQFVLRGWFLWGRP